MDTDEIGAGDTLGHYELLLPLAQGGTASVWVARMRGDHGFERLVAVKMILSDLEEEDTDTQSMLLDEARTVSRIRHPNVGEVYDVGETEGVFFLVMEWIDGEPLQVISREARKLGPLPIPLAVAIAKQACAGLHSAHELCDDAGHSLDLVHRDVSPQNILVGFDGVVKVIDFGVAKATSNLQRTTVGQIKGKAAFMAPEQATGKPVDRRTDVFALGTVLYQLISGKHPFPGDNEFAVMLRIGSPTEAELLSTVRPDCPPELDAVIAQALAKSKELRFSSLLEFQRALDRAIADTPGYDEIGAFMKKLVGARGDKRRENVRAAIRTADEKQPTQRVTVDKQRVSRHSERPLAMEAGATDEADTQVGNSPEYEALLRDETARGNERRASTRPGAPPAAVISDDDSIDPAAFRSRKVPVIAILAIFAILAMAYFALRD